MKPIAPPFPNDDSFYCRFFTEVGSYQDVAGRRLHEVDFRDEEGEQAFKKCPFHDSRNGYLINQAALKQITSEWQKILQGIKFFTSLYEVENEKNADLARAWRISLGSMFAPLYLFHRNDNAFENGQLPTSVSGVFKIMLDMPTTLDLMFVEGHDRNVVTATGKETATAIQKFANKHSILLNGEHACAGPPGMIDNVSEILFENLKSSDAQFDEWNSYFAKKEEFQTFCYGMTNQYVMGLMFQMATMVSMETAYKTLHEQGKNIPLLGGENENRLSAYERRRRFVLNIINEPSRFEDVFNQLIGLVSDSNQWNISGSHAYEIEQCRDLSLDFIERTIEATPSEISALHTKYCLKLKPILTDAQSKINTTIGTSRMFADEIFLGRLVETPAILLQRLCISENPSTNLFPSM